MERYDSLAPAQKKETKIVTPKKEEKIDIIESEENKESEQSYQKTGFKNGNKFSNQKNRK